MIRADSNLLNQLDREIVGSNVPDVLHVGIQIRFREQMIVNRRNHFVD
jgi:hypothetical protein